MFQIPAIFLKIPKNVISVLDLTSVASAGWLALRVHNGWRRSNRRKKPRHRNFFLEIDLHFIEGVTVEFIK